MVEFNDEYLSAHWKIFQLCSVFKYVNANVLENFRPIYLVVISERQCNVFVKI